MRQFICISTESNRIEQSNNYKMVSYNIDADTEEAARQVAETLIPPAFRLMCVIEDIYGPDWVSSLEAPE